MLNFESFFLKGNYHSIASKSYMFRALHLSLMAKNTTIENPLYNDDVNNLLEIYEKMGANLKKEENTLKISFDDIKLLDFYDFKNSGTALRFMTGYLALNKDKDSKIVITGDEQLRNRKIEELLKALKELGLNYRFLSSKELPFEISSRAFSGKCKVFGKSSQFLSSLLLNLAFFDKESTIEVKELHERPYIDITLEFLNDLNVLYENDNYRKFNIKSSKKMKEIFLKLPGDYSSASYIILASAIRGDVKIYGLDRNSIQADRFILYFLEKVGFKIEYHKDYFKITGSIKRGGEFDLNSCPDLFPALSFFSANFPFDFKFHNLESARYKESDRIATVANILKNIGIGVKEFKDGIFFKGGFSSKTNTIDSNNDHRIIMSSILLGMRKDYKINILNHKNLLVSYPNFFKDLYKLG